MGKKLKLRTRSSTDLKKKSIKHLEDIKYKTYTEEFDEIIKARFRR